MLDVAVPATNLQAVLHPKQEAERSNEQVLLRSALAEPIGSPQLRDLARRGQKVVIDETVISGESEPYIIYDGGEKQAAASD